MSACPCCDVVSAGLSPVQALVLGHAIGVSPHPGGRSLLTLCCDAHRAPLLRAMLDVTAALDEANEAAS